MRSLAAFGMTAYVLDSIPVEKQLQLSYPFSTTGSDVCLTRRWYNFNVSTQNYLLLTSYYLLITIFYQLPIPPQTNKFQLKTAWSLLLNKFLLYLCCIFPATGFHGVNCDDSFSYLFNISIYIIDN